MASLPIESAKNLMSKNTLPPPQQHRQKTKPFPRRLVPFRHPDFTDDQIQRLTEGSQLAKDRLLKSLRKLNSSPPHPSSLLPLSSQTSSSSSCASATATHLTVGHLNNGQSGGDGFSPGSVSPGGTGSDGELLSAVMARLVWLETNLSEAHRQLQEKEKTVAHLEEQIEILTQARAVHDGTSSIHELEETCLRLHKQGNEMEKFLNEYGLVWSPDEKQNVINCKVRSLLDGRDDRSLQSSSCHSRGASPTADDDGERDTYGVDYDLVIDNIRDLNVLAGEGVPQICLSSEGARFRLIEHVPLALYANGISLCGGPFRSFGDCNTRQCIQDLMDGYFPSELQHRYPNGVPLKVTDKRNDEFKEKHPSARSVLSMDTLSLPTSRSPSLSPVSPHSPSSPTNSSTSSPGRTPDSVPHVSFPCPALPRSVVTEEKLVDVRLAASQIVKSRAYGFDFVLVETPVVQHLREGRVTDQVTTLRIRSETGNETYLMKLYTTDTICDIRKYLDLQRLSDSSEYDIIALYPRRVFNRSDDTLLACGLVPNAALYLRHSQREQT